MYTFEKTKSSLRVMVVFIYITQSKKYTATRVCVCVCRMCVSLCGYVAHAYIGNVSVSVGVTRANIFAVVNCTRLVYAHKCLPVVEENDPRGTVASQRLSG